MYLCKSCKTQLDDLDIFCPTCGTKRVTEEYEVLECQNIEAKGKENLNLLQHEVRENESEKIEYEVSIKENKDEHKFFLTTVENVEKFGVFVRYNNKLNALCHMRHLKKPLSEYKKGDAIWVREMSPFDQQKKSVEEAKPGFYETRYKEFTRFYKVGDKVKGRIDSKKNNMLFVEVYPGFNASIRKDSLATENFFNQCKENDFIQACIDSMDEGKRRVYLTQKGMEEVDEIYDILPESTVQISIPQYIFMKYRDVTGKENATDNEIRKTIFDSFKRAYKKNKFISSYKMNEFVFELNDRTKYGGPLSAEIRENQKESGKPWYVSNVKSSGKLPSHSIELFANIPRWEKQLSELHEQLLEGEDWSSQDGKKKYFILEKYLNFTFYCARNQGKVVFSADRDFAAFDTGLVDKNYEAIYGCFASIKEPQKRDWELEGFAKFGIGFLGKKLNAKLTKRPQKVQYFTNIYDVYFDTSKPIERDRDHILIDNLSRIPIQFIREQCGRDDEREIGDLVSDIERKVDVEQNIKRLQEYIKKEDSFSRKLAARLDEAIDVARKRCEWNYKTAIPIFYHEINGLSLLLPLSLLGDHQSADVALVLEKVESGNYQGQTILTLPMAYLDARLICRPNSEWLRADVVNSQEDNQEE